MTDPYRSNEPRLAHKLIKALPDNAITLFDKQFRSANLLLSSGRQGENRHWLLPAHKNMVSAIQESYGAKDRLLRMNTSGNKTYHCRCTGMHEQSVMICRVWRRVVDQIRERINVVVI